MISIFLNNLYNNNIIEKKKITQLTTFPNFLITKTYLMIKKLWDLKLLVGWFSSYFFLMILLLYWINIFVLITILIATISTSFYKLDEHYSSPVSWGCRIHRQHFCRGVISTPTPPPNLPEYNIKQSYDDALAWEICHCSWIHSDLEL